MMTNLFNIFDPSTTPTLSLNWTSMLIMLMFLPYQFWMIPPRFLFIPHMMMNFMFNELNLSLKTSLANITIFISMFMFISFNNLMGLFPYIFTASSHLSFSLSLSLFMWTSIMLFAWINFSNSMFINLTPMNTPYVLMPFMVIIEFISLAIRPITLSIRLTANMISGHLLLSLLGSTGMYINSLLIIWMLLVTQLILLILEISVSLIQAYVFSILSSLYSKEI